MSRSAGGAWAVKVAELLLMLSGMGAIVWINPWRGLFDPYAPPLTTGENWLLLAALVMIGVPVFAACDRYFRSMESDRRKAP